MASDGFGTFFLPGPTEVRQEILRAMLRPMIGHRSPEFEDLFARIQQGLSSVLRTGRQPFVSTSSGTGLMEAAIRNAPSGRVLSLVNGAFSARFADISRACGRETEELAVPWGSISDPDDLRRLLGRRRFAALTVAHSETSTGALNDVASIARIAREAGVATIVDSVSGAAGAPLEPDAWELDFVLTGSQKAFALPPGLAFGVASPTFVESAMSASDRGRYFDLEEFDRYGARHQTPNTPAVSLLYALDAQLVSMEREGIEARWARHAEMAAFMHEWVASAADRIGVALEVLAPSGFRSPTVTVVALPPGITAPEVVREAGAEGYTISDGYGPLSDSTFRVGHMGDHTLDTLRGCLEACDTAIRRLAA